MAFVLSLSATAAAQNADAVTDARVAASRVRLRFGVSTGGGLVLATPPSGGGILPGETWGFDVRVGAQLTDLVALYVQPSIMIGVMNNACFGMTEAVLALWAPAMVDFTFAHRFSVAAGAGLAAVPGEPPGWTVHVRAAGYPLMRRLPLKNIREGLMLGLDTRAYSLNAGGSEYVGAIIMLALGYERF
ncbi:MAG TPA: hypothetical protein VGH87_13230 [Polyangiaceae bacterium]